MKSGTSDRILSDLATKIGDAMAERIRAKSDNPAERLDADTEWMYAVTDALSKAFAAGRADAKNEIRERIEDEVDPEVPHR